MAVRQRERPGFWVGLAMTTFVPGTHLLAARRDVDADRIPRTGGALLVLNHISNLDPFYDAVFVRSQGRNPHSFAKHSLWQHPIVRQAMSGSGQIPVERGSMSAGRSLRAGLDALRAGKVVLTYPEGTITADPGYWPMAAHVGAARLALDIADDGVPVLPIARWGTQAILDHGQRLHPLPRHTVTYRVGEPLDLSAYQGRRVTHAHVDEVTEHLMARITELLATIRGRAAPGLRPMGGK